MLVLCVHTSKLLYSYMYINISERYVHMIIMYTCVYDTQSYSCWMAWTKDSLANASVFVNQHNTARSIAHLVVNELVCIFTCKHQYKRPINNLVFVNRLPKFSQRVSCVASCARPIACVVVVFGSAFGARFCRRASAVVDLADILDCGADLFCVA